MPTARIEKPTPFEQWIQTEHLFDDDATKTETYVTNGHEDGTRFAYGKCSEGWCFYIVMTPAEEPVFWQAYHKWLRRNPSEHHRASINATKPPNCGTPNTPVCPDAASGQGSTRAREPTTSGGVRAA